MLKSNLETEEEAYYSVQWGGTLQCVRFSVVAGCWTFVSLRICLCHCLSHIRIRPHFC